jgi:CheY-like chemotaxis protein
MGGAIRLDSEVGEGSRFTVDLPFLVASTQRVEAAPASASDEVWRVSPPSILVAEDNDVNPRLMLLMLRKLGCRADFVADGRSAVDRVAAGSFDLVFMDVEMPGMDGLEATRLIRRQAPHQPHIIALTAYSFDTQRQTCLAAGMNDFLSKPLRLPELRAALQRFHRRHAVDYGHGQDSGPS